MITYVKATNKHKRTTLCQTAQHIPPPREFQKTADFWITFTFEIIAERNWGLMISALKELWLNVLIFH
ncbi:hypothetical protein RB195_020051 [Necator americanus]|uniref:Uncharacterized protein n=1 Tax=Necator americanus TaxID=51031 RepID=A0ABR1CKI2_NECAM